MSVMVVPEVEYNTCAFSIRVTRNGLVRIFT